ncbi:MAG: acetylglutamate kinase [Paramuribaculum sp.]|nr:acetylglutamate kinase [Paramuribaculum sp.]
MISVVKIGGNVVDNPEALSRFVKDFAAMEGPKILVHGGGKEATRLSERLDIPTTMIDGRRVTTRETLDVVTMVYAGLINKRIVSALQSCGCNALGLSGADGNIIPAKKRPTTPIDYGFVGDIDAARINTAFLATLLDSGIVPVFCAIMHDGSGSLLNCNADSVASAVAVAASTIAPTRLIFCFEKDGVLTDVDNPDSLIESVTRSSYVTLKQDGVVNKGMIPKIDNAFAAITSGVSSVTIKHSDNLLKNRGTTITE